MECAIWNALDIWYCYAMNEYLLEQFRFCGRRFSAVVVVFAFTRFVLLFIFVEHAFPRFL